MTEDDPTFDLNLKKKKKKKKTPFDLDAAMDGAGGEGAEEERVSKFISLKGLGFVTQEYIYVFNQAPIQIVFCFG